MNSNSVQRWQTLLAGPSGALGLSAALGLGALALYTCTLAPGALGGDAGEMQFVPYILSLAHPTGYPLQTLLGFVWAHLVPIGSVAYRLNLLSACAAAMTLVLLYFASRERGHTPLVALAGPLLLGLSTIFWDQAVLADKYALNAALLAIVILLLTRWLKRGSFSALAAVACAYGLSLTHHRSMILFAPFLLSIWAWRGRSLVRQPRRLLLILTALLAPLLLYFYLPIGLSRGLPPGSWRQASLIEWLRYLADQGYISSVRPDVNFLNHIGFYLQTLAAQFTPLGIALGLIGLAYSVRRRDPLNAVLFPGFALVAGLASGYEVPRHWLFFLPTFVVFAVWIADGVAAIGVWAAARRAPLRYASLSLTGLAVLGAAGWLLYQNFPVFRQASLDGGINDLWRQDLKRGYTAERFAALSLTEAAPDAVIVGDWEQATALWYKQQVEGARSDVTVLYPIERWEEALALGRPTYLARTLPDLGAPYHFTSAGPLIRISAEPVTEVPPTAQTSDFNWENVVVLAGYRYHFTDFKMGHVLPVTLYWRVVTASMIDYSISIRLFDEGGNQMWAEDRSKLAQGMILPQRAAPGEVIGEYVEIPAPRSLPAGQYQIGLIVYVIQDGSFRNLTLGNGEQVALLPPVTIPPR